MANIKYIMRRYPELEVSCDPFTVNGMGNGKMIKNSDSGFTSKEPDAFDTKSYSPSAFDQEYLQVRLGKFVRAPYEATHFQTHFSRYWHILEVKKDDVVLDLGCGTGYNSWFFAQMAGQVVGVDISKGAVEFAQRHYQRENLTYLQGNILEWAPKEKFSLIIMIAVFEHLPLYEGNLLLKRIKKWLRPNGRIGLHVPIGKSWVNRLRKRRRKITTLDSTGDPTHLRFFSVNEVRDLVYTAGYELLGEAPLYGGLILSRKWIRWLIRLFRPPVFLRDQMTMDLFLVSRPLKR